MNKEVPFDTRHNTQQSCTKDPARGDSSPSLRKIPHFHRGGELAQPPRPLPLMAASADARVSARARLRAGEARRRRTKQKSPAKGGDIRGASPQGCRCGLGNRASYTLSKRIQRTSCEREGAEAGGERGPYRS